MRAAEIRVPAHAVARLRPGSVLLTPLTAEWSSSAPPVWTTGVNECPRPRSPRRSRGTPPAMTSAATSSSSRGAAAKPGLKDWLPTQFVSRMKRLGCCL
jgi:hypothetical protein